MSDEFKEKLRREILIHDFGLTQEELEMLEFVLNLYINTEEHPKFFERLLERIQKKLKKIEHEKKLEDKKQELKK